MKNFLSANRKRMFFCAKLFFTILLIYILFLNVDFLQVLKEFNKINYFILIPLLLYPVSLWLSAFKWSIALVGNKESLVRLFSIYWISNFFSNFLPSSIGGDSYKVIKLRKEYPLSKVLMSILLDRGSGIIAIFITVFILSSYSSLYLESDLLILIRSTVILFVIFLIILFFLTEFKFNKKINDLQIFIKKHFLLFLNLVCLSLPFVLMGAISTWIYYLMFGYNINFLQVLFIYSIIQIINMAPFSINGLGVREGSYIYFFLPLGVPAEVSLAISIISRFVMLLQTGIGGIIYLKIKD